MKETNQNLGDMNIVPERDELRSHGNKQRGTSRPAASANTGSAGTSGAVKFFLTLTVLGMIATGGAGYIVYTQGQVALDNLENAQGRIAQLENRLSMVGEAAEQSSMGFLERVDFNFSEIDKLWAARNKNLAELTANQVALSGNSDSISAIETALSNQAGNVNQHGAQLGQLETQIETLAANFSGMGNLGQQLDKIDTEISDVKRAMASLETEMSNRVNTTEQDIESININRLQLNQRINSLQDSLNSLQQQAIQ